MIDQQIFLTLYFVGLIWIMFGSMVGFFLFRPGGVSAIFLFGILGFEFIFAIIAFMLLPGIWGVI